MKRKFGGYAVDEIFPELLVAQRSLQRNRNRRIGKIFIGILFLLLIGLGFFFSQNPSELPAPTITSTPTDDSENYRKRLLDIDRLRNQAIEYRDAGLIYEYADPMSPVFAADKELMNALITKSIEVSEIHYEIHAIAFISLRRSGQSEYARIRVQDSRSSYRQIINEVATTIPPRSKTWWIVELFRKSQNSPWTLWSIEPATEPQR